MANFSVIFDAQTDVRVETGKSDGHVISRGKLSDLRHDNCHISSASPALLGTDVKSDSLLWLMP